MAQALYITIPINTVLIVVLVISGGPTQRRVVLELELTGTNEGMVSILCCRLLLLMNQA